MKLSNRIGKDIALDQRWPWVLGVSAGVARMSSGMPGTVRGRFGGVVGIAHTGRMRWLVRQEEGGGRRQAGTAGHRWLCGLTGRAFWGHPFIPIPNKGNAKECSNYCTIALISHCSKFSQPGFSSLWIVNFLMFKLVLEKAEEPKVKLPTSTGSSKKQESSRKTSISALLTMPKPLTVWLTINCGKFWKRWEYQTTWPASWEICMQIRKQQLELYVKQQTSSK